MSPELGRAPSGSDLPFVPADLLKGKHVFLLGSTGFLGKVTAAMLLDRCPDVGRVYLMVRSAGSGSDSADRFWTSIATSPPFEPLRERHGPDLAAFLKSKIVIVDGDVTQPDLGMTPERAAEVAADIDVLVNCSGKVDFNPPLETSLRTNVTGTQHTLAFVKRMKVPRYVHTSTCFVAGNRSGEVWENEPVAGYFPKRGQEGFPEFDPDREIADCERLAVRVKEEAHDRLLEARFRETALARFREEGRDPDDAAGIKLGIARERKNWVRERLSALGLERALGWGWPNIYTYCKSLAEQLVARETTVVRAIIRPAIVESAVAFPFPGWNEGFNTSAPFIHAATEGQPIVPSNPRLILDLIPVDYVAASVLLVTAKCLEGDPELVYQCCSGDRNPLLMDRIVTILGLFKRRFFQAKTTGNKLVNEVAARMETQVTNPAVHEKWVIPALERTFKFLTEGVDGLANKSLGPLKPLAAQVKDAALRADTFVKDNNVIYTTFKPFVVENEFIFRADHLHGLVARMNGHDRGRLAFAPESIDWYDYLLNVHFPGLERWVFPKLEEEKRPVKAKKVHAHATLHELFDVTTRRHATRLAMRIQRGKREELYTYADLRECALRAAAFLVGAGVQPGDRIALISENSPEWAMAYFGILYAGATAVPLERESVTSEIAGLLQAGDARGLILSSALHRRHGALPARLAALGISPVLWSMDEVFALGDETREKERIAALPPAPKPDALASILFTSGTTGNPKGVMLTHRNFAGLVARLLSVVEFTHDDGMLSVLPLHHAFEFTGGLVCPLARGAQITYLPRLSEDTIKDALKAGHTTVIVGVPALWKMLKKGIEKKLGEKTGLAKRAFEAATDAAYHWYEETGINAGAALFWPVHEAFGGRIRYLISGGAALPADVAKTFRGLGFELLEGYGLSESSPVLTVVRPGSLPPLGSVGQPLPGVEIRLLNPDRRGVGEVAARGPNIMAGYYKNPEATAAVLHDGWLHTGDLGRLDEHGHLFIVGRAKDVIIGLNGKNVYPDEVEEAYAKSDVLKELCVVGLTEGGTERVACLAVPAEGSGDAAGERAAKVREHFDTVSAGLPVHKRVKVLEIQEEDLPRTPTKKVKRREVADLIRKLQASRPAGTGARAAEGGRGDGPATIESPIALPAELCTLGSELLNAGQTLAFTAYFKPTYRGRNYVPRDRNFIVAANHSSHLDMGLIKMALEEAGPPLVTLAAADYFFDNDLKKVFFRSFTSIMPLDRQGSPRRSYKQAIDQMKQGRSLLIFPEGTRTRTGRIQPFQRGLGFLAMHARVGILPIHLSTYDALPPGTVYPKQREVEARIGPFLSHDFLLKLTEGLSTGETERLIVAFTQRCVETLRDGGTPELDVEATRRAWERDGRNAASREPVTSAGSEDDV